MTQRTVTVVGEGQRVRSVSDDVSATLVAAVDRIDTMDTDPIMRLALARVAIRSFAGVLARRFGPFANDIAAELETVAGAIRTGSLESGGADMAEMADTAAAARAPKPVAAAEGGETDAGDQEPLGEAGGGGQADPQGAEPDGGGREGPRDHGAERVGKVDAVLRVGGA
ncbi:MAG: hypothetical protein AAF713_07895 [Pseudomonadota bacterium]